MKVVSTSKLKRAREKSEAAVAFANKMQNMLLAVAGGVKGESGKLSLLAGNGSDKVQLFIVITADRGLCGAFNISIAKLVRIAAEQVLAEGKKLQMICIGKKGYELLKRQYQEHIIEHRNGSGGKGVQYSEAYNIADKVLDLFTDGKIDQCHIFYTKFKSVISQVPTRQQLIPLPAEALDQGDEVINAYEFEPSEEEILNDLLPKNLRVQVYKALLESHASEHGSRMTAMDNATRNSGDMIKRLNLVYNRTRQAYITKELIEIISGAEAI
jgi:F-type H+-transporting ATPase subunit gamma